MGPAAARIPRDTSRWRSIALWYHELFLAGIDERSTDQEVRGRDSGARARAEAGASQRNQARTRARRSSRERRIRSRQRTPAPRGSAYLDAQEARGGNRADQR